MPSIKWIPLAVSCLVLVLASRADASQLWTMAGVTSDERTITCQGRSTEDGTSGGATTNPSTAKPVLYTSDIKCTAPMGHVRISSYLLDPALNIVDSAPSGECWDQGTCGLFSEGSGDQAFVPPGEYTHETDIVLMLPPSDGPIPSGVSKPDPWIAYPGGECYMDPIEWQTLYCKFFDPVARI